MRSDGVELATSASVPSGPLYETSAESPDVASAIGAEEFGLLFKVARRVGVAELGIDELITAASAVVEKGFQNENAYARFGISDVTRATATKLTMKKFELNLIGKRGISVGLSSTKTA